jgi:hypothetical protein
MATSSLLVYQLVILLLMSRLLNYSSSLILLEVSLANYSFRKSIVGQNPFLLFWSPAASLICHWLVDQVGGRGLLHES